MKNQINVGDQNTQQIGQNPTNQHVQLPEKPKINYWMISTILLLLLVFASVAFFIFRFYIKSNISSDSQTITSRKTNQNLIPEHWKSYNDNGLSFRYSPDWIIESPNKTVFGNEKMWRISRNRDGNRSTFLLISRVRKYDPMPGSDSLRSYISEWSGVEKRGIFVKDTTFKGQKAIRYTDPGEKTSQATDTIVISVPESELLLISFSDDWTSADNWSHVSLAQSVKKYFDPFLQSLEISSTSWPQPGTYLSIVSSNNSKPTDWSKFTGKGYTFSYPNYWNVGYKDISGEQSLDLVKIGAEKGETGLNFPEVSIGNGEVFTTSGALCANAGLGECEEVGQAEIKVKERTYAAPIIKKRLWKDGRLTDSFYYVFQVSLNRIPTQPNIVTAVFKTQDQGQEIVNILSTISY